MKSIISIATTTMRGTRNTFAVRLFMATAIVALVAPLSVKQSAAQEPAVTAAASLPVFVNGIRPQDEIVVVSTRKLCGTCDSESIRAGLEVETYAIRDTSGRRQWQQSDLQSFLTFDPSVRTVFFVHGNQITPWDAQNDGLNVYRRLLCYGANDERIRFVIFSWPSSKVGGLLQDVRVKAARTAPAGCELAWILDQMPAETPLSLVGFSYGSRIITGGLHILAGGNLGNLRLSERMHPNRPPVHVALMGTAMHAYWLGEGQYHGQALSQVDEAFFVNSCDDPAMKWYHLSIPGRGGPQALGLRGPTNLSAEQWSKVSLRGIGARHDLYMYLSAPGVAAQVWDTLTNASAAAPQAN